MGLMPLVGRQRSCCLCGTVEDGRIVDPEEIREFIETLDKHGIRQLVISLSVSVKVNYIRREGVMAHAIGNVGSLLRCPWPDTDDRSSAEGGTVTVWDTGFQSGLEIYAETKKTAYWITIGCLLAGN